jgi:hypothetical protein
MFQYAIAALSERTKHPMLVSLVGLAALFVVVGVIVDRLTGNGVASGFSGVYAVIAFTLASPGYALLFGGQLVSALGRNLDDA